MVFGFGSELVPQPASPMRSFEVAAIRYRARRGRMDGLVGSAKDRVVADDSPQLRDGRERALKSLKASKRLFGHHLRAKCLNVRAGAISTSPTSEIRQLCKMSEGQ